MADTEFLDAPGFGWTSLAGPTWTVRYVGRRACAQAILDWLETTSVGWSTVEFGTMLSSLPNEWAMVASSGGRLVAATDKVRSYPLFYSDSGPPGFVSNSPRMLRARLPDAPALYAPLLELSMAGYVTGSDTLFGGVRQLQAGELLAASGSDGRFLSHRYYRYLPKPEEDRDRDAWVDELAATTEGIFRRLVEEAGGRPLLVPLSGGLDSRLIVCMLRHLGYDNVRTFSYGPAGNYEAKIARRVAEKAGYPWEFVATTHAGFREYFWSAARREYWAFCDGLCTVPNMQDIYPLLELRKRGLSGDTIVVNGQSGDFISGGHVPARLLKAAGRETLLAALTEKHFALRKSLRTPANLLRITGRIEALFREMEATSGCAPHPAALYESWEWQERQCKYVIGGQRIYDWLGLDWRLPLWDADYLQFWSRVPLELKLDQRLYKDYLRARDYCGLFRNFSPTVWRWPGAAMAVLPTAQLIGLLGGRRAKDRFYAYARYIGHYGPYYAPWGWRKFLARAMDIRNALPLFIETWMEENGVGVASDTDLRRAMS